MNPKLFPNDARPGQCGVRAYIKYEAKKPAAALVPEYKFFLNAKTIAVENWDSLDCWYSTQHMGVGHLGNYVARQLKATGFDFGGQKISATSIRKTAIDGSMMKSMPGAFVSEITGHKSLSSKLGYMSTNDITLKAANRTIQDIMGGVQSGSKDFGEIF